MSRVRRFRSLVSFDGEWFIATSNLSTWASSSCVIQHLSCSLPLLEFTHSFSCQLCTCCRTRNSDTCERPKAAGASRQPENSKRAHMRVQALQEPPKFHMKITKRGKRERQWVLGEEEQSEILGRSCGGGPGVSRGGRVRGGLSAHTDTQHTTRY